MRRAKYWKQKGYNLDPNFMNGEEMDQKVKDIDRSRYWKQHGYDFDPYSMTARQMDKQAEELNEVELWKKRGYYYDPNSKTVFIDKQKRTKLKSLAGLHGGGTSFPSISPRSAYLSAKILPPVSISPSGNGKIYLFTGGGHWVKNKIDSGNFIQLEDNSLWQVSPIDRINCSLWLNMDEIAVIESQNPYYPYLLINTDDAEKVEAKLISD